MSRANIDAGAMAFGILLGLTEPFLDVARLLEHALEGVALGFTFEALEKKIIGVWLGQMRHYAVTSPKSVEVR